MNYYEHHLGDWAKDAGYLTMIREGCYRRLIDVYYNREGPLPGDLKECYELARCTSGAEREAVRYVIDRFFDLREDGYHQKRCDQEIARYHESEPEREAKREAEKERQRRHRERRSKLFAELRDLGLTPSWDATIADLERMLSRHKNSNGHANGHAPVTPVTRDNTATSPHSPVPNHHSPDTHPPQPLPGREGRVRGERRRRDEPETSWRPPTEEEIRAGK